MSNISFKWNRPVDSIVKDAVKKRQTVMYMANTARKLMDPYVPMYMGNLAKHVTISGDETKATITYTMPYAAQCFYATSRRFSKERHPYATAHWDKAMMQVHKQTLISDVQKFIKSGAS